MNRADLLPYANEKLLAIVLLVISFIPLEPSCIPGNKFLLFAPFVFVGIRYAVHRRLRKIDVFIALGFFILVIFMALLAFATNCHQGYTFNNILQPEWQKISIDSLGPDGKLYIRNIKSIQIPTADIILHVNGTQLPCQWQGSAIYIAPDETVYCQLPIPCGNRTIPIDIYAPGNNDSVMC